MEAKVGILLVALEALMAVECARLATIPFAFAFTFAVTFAFALIPVDKGVCVESSALTEVEGGS